MRRWGIWVLSLALLACPVNAMAGYWSADREIHCQEHLPGCRILQMVMMDAFEASENRDPVNERVLAAAWPRLLEVTEADLVHFSDEFKEDIGQTRIRWYGAMAECLRAFIDQQAQPSLQQRTLMLFLDGSDTVEARRAREEIRRDMTEPALQSIAGDIAAPEEFVRWLLYDRV